MSEETELVWNREGQDYVAELNGVKARIQYCSDRKYYWRVELPDQFVSKPRNDFQWGECKRLNTAKSKVAALIPGAAKV